MPVFYRPGHKSLITTTFIILAILVLLSLSCQPKRSGQDTTNIVKTDKQEDAADKDAAIEARSSSSLPGFLDGFEEGINIHYTYPSSNGNKITPVKADLSSYIFTDIALNGSPEWIVAGRTDKDSIWVVTYKDGSNQVFRINREDEFFAEEISENSPGLDHSSPPVLITSPEDFYLLEKSYYANNDLTHPIIFGSPFSIASISPDGSLLVQGVEEENLPKNILTDSRIITDEKGYLYLLTDPTDKYAHGILGDKYEASSITILDSKDGYKIINEISMVPGNVIESLYPIVLDIDDDGKNEIIVTVSNKDDGSRIVVFDLDGNLVMEGISVGKGMRWRHQLAVGPFSPEKELELVDVLTPHIGGVVDFYRFNAKEGLGIISSIEGYSSHKIGSRNLDTVLAGDFDEDGQFEIIVPRQDFLGLGVIKHTKKGAVVLFELETGARISTNIASAADSSGGLLVGIGLESGILRIWHKK
jgi:hypothetical protein